MERICWKVNLFKDDAQKCFEEMGSCDITPQKVLDIARNGETELHKCFEWDDSVAAEKYRIKQAGDVIRNICIVKTEEEEYQPRRVFQISSTTSTYQPVQFFKRNEDEYKMLLERAVRELKAIQNRYKSIVELEKVFDAINEI